MSMQTVFEDAARRVDALDLSPENDRVTDLKQQIANIEEALRQANARREEILVALRPFRDGGSSTRSFQAMEENRRFIADALLSGQSPSEAAGGTVDAVALERERESLGEGIFELNTRLRSLQQELSQTRYAAGKRALEELRPLCEALKAEAREAANVIVRNFASLSALGRATKSNAPGLRRVGEAAAGVRGADNLVSPSDMLDVPEEIVALVTLLNDKGAAGANGVLATVQVRDKEQAAIIGELMSPTPRRAPEPQVREPQSTLAKAYRKIMG